MAVDYDAIANDQSRLERTAANSIRTLINLYADRAHFLFELLQNTEDALRRRPADWSGPRSVKFQLCPQSLLVSHYGAPFDKSDVENICSVGETAKELTDIGHFGIGFKSVYAFTDCPTIHSGQEDFAIRDYVRPATAPSIDRGSDETVIVMPFKTDAALAHVEVARGLGRLDASALLFLRETEEIRWSVEGGRSGLYLRESKEFDLGVRRVTIMGKEHGQPELEEEWLIFSRPVTAVSKLPAGQVELAFFLAKAGQSQRERIECLESSPLVVFFPTALETHLGFLVQGPYRTTPSRENVPSSDDWNRHLVDETALLFRQVLRWLRDNDFLDSAGLQCLPIETAKFRETKMFAPLYNAAKSAFSSERLLPRFHSGHVAAGCARLGRTQELRALITPSQLAELYGKEGQLAWLSGDITQDRTPELRRYLMQELDVQELTTDAFISRLGKEFLEAQSDSWIEKLYEFLSGQPSLRWRLRGAPLIRLEDGTHVPPYLDEQAQAFLPSKIATDFPLVRSAVCASETALEFLRSLGLTLPDPIDDVVRNVLPRYQADEVNMSDGDYEADIGRILKAYGTDSKRRRENLVAALRKSAFVMTLDAGDGSKAASKPGEAYLATELLRELFSGVDGILLVDCDHPCLVTEPIRELLEVCGVAGSLRTVTVECDLTSQQLDKIRRDAGLERCTWEQTIPDLTLHGLNELLRLLPRMDPVERKRKAALLWEALTVFEKRRGSQRFLVEYTWSYSHETKSSNLDAAFVRNLNESKWVPDSEGSLHAPELVPFETLGWKRNPFLLSKIRFRLPIIDELAKEAGIEPGVLDLLKSLGVTSESELRKRLGLQDHNTFSGNEAEDLQHAVEKLLGVASEPTRPVGLADQGRVEQTKANSHARIGPVTGTGDGENSRRGARVDVNTQEQGPLARPTEGRRTPGSAGGRQFISYLSVHLDEEEQDPAGLDQPARMALEKCAIDFILSTETGWQQTPTHNPGFDLYELGPDEHPTRWCEVKAMTGSFIERPAALSRAQFECAREKGESYWLYVVEQAGTNSARIVRIQDPAGKARSFTFDHGWLEVAKLDSKEGTL